MTKFEVRVTDSALSAISDQARYIALDRQAPDAAQRWLEQVWNAVDSLEQCPFRAARAEEDNFVAYEVRQLIVGRHLLLFRLTMIARSYGSSVCATVADTLVSSAISCSI